MPVPHSHIDIISLHDAAEVLVGGEDPVETVVVDVGYNHLEGDERQVDGDVRRRFVETLVYQPDIWQMLDII